MHYEINVSKLDDGNFNHGHKTYRHFFATAERSITTKVSLKLVLTELMKVFKMPEYKISVSREEKVGNIINVEEILLDKV